MKKLIVVLAFMTLGGCAAGYSAVGPGTTTVAGGAIAVSPGIAWNKAPTGDPKSTEIWTMDGANLDSVTYIGGLKDGEGFIKPQNSNDRVPTFRSDMLPNEIAEMIEATFVTRKGGSFDLEGLKPRAFAGEDGFEITYTYTQQSDLVIRKGMAVGAIKDGKLYMILFEAPDLYYFDRHLGEANRIIESASLR